MLACAWEWLQARHHTSRGEPQRLGKFLDHLAVAFDENLCLIEGAEKILLTAFRAAGYALCRFQYRVYIAALVMREMEQLREQQDRLQEEQTRLEWRRDQWQASQDYLARLEVWCQSIAQSLDHLTYEEKRTLFAAIDMRVTVWKVKDRDPRYQVDAVIDLDSTTTPIPCTCHICCTC